MRRRDFLRQTVTTGIAVAGSSALLQRRARAVGPNDKVSVAVVGVRGRGNNLLNTFADLPDVTVKYVCDIDQSVLNNRTAELESRTGQRPERIADYRRALDDADIDALVLGTPDHWHALPTIHGAQAGKDVYVEKPDGHNLIEGRTMVAAAKKYGRIVQLGTQSRSSPHMLRAIEFIRGGALGRVHWAKAWESGRQGSIGNPPDSEPPEGVDYNTWLGPAPKRAFNPMRYHGNWRWFFDYGTGDLGNDGVHRLDYARWAFDEARRAAGQQPLPDFPTKVSATGGKHYFDDAQEWPDNLLASFEYPDGLLNYELRIWSGYPLHGEPEGAAVYGENGYLVLGNRRWRAFGLRDEPLAEDRGDYADSVHAQNFIDCMRTRARPAADLETVGHPASVLCHLGNAAWRAGRTLEFDAETYTFKGDDEANLYRTRPEYRAPWVLPDIASL